MIGVYFFTVSHGMKDLFYTHSIDHQKYGKGTISLNTTWMNETWLKIKVKVLILASSEALLQRAHSEKCVHMILHC